MHTEQGPFEVVDLDSPFIFGIGRKCTAKELQQARDHGRMDEVPMSICGITSDGIAGVMGEGTANLIVHCVNTHALLRSALEAAEEADALSQHLDELWAQRAADSAEGFVAPELDSVITRLTGDLRAFNEKARELRRAALAPITEV